MLNLVGTFRGPPTRAVLEKAMALADGLSGPPAEVVLDRVESRADDAALVLTGDEGVADVVELQAALRKELATGSMAPRRPPPFEPHVVLIGDGKAVPTTTVPAIGWRAREFVLLDAVVGDGRQEVLKRWPLTG